MLSTKEMRPVQADGVERVTSAYIQVHFKGRRPSWADRRIAVIIDEDAPVSIARGDLHNFRVPTGVHDVCIAVGVRRYRSKIHVKPGIVQTIFVLNDNRVLKRLAFGELCISIAWLAWAFAHAQLIATTPIYAYPTYGFACWLIYTIVAANRPIEMIFYERRMVPVNDK